MKKKERNAIIPTNPYIGQWKLSWVHHNNNDSARFFRSDYEHGYIVK